MNPSEEPRQLTGIPSSAASRQIARGSPPGDLVVPAYTASAPMTLTATTQREYAVPEADQGVAVQDRDAYIAAQEASR